MPIVHADLIFLYVQIAAKQNSHGFTRGDLSTRVPGFPGNSRMWEIPRGDLPARGVLPCHVSEKRVPSLLVASEVRNERREGTCMFQAKRGTNVVETLAKLS